MAESAEVLKREISEAYIKSFKKELGWLKSLTLLPIENKIKNMMIGKTELPGNFEETKNFGWREKVINFFSPSFANNIYKFIREKNNEIEKRKTTNELLDLKKEVIAQTETLTGAQTETQTGAQTETQTGAQTETQTGAQTETQTGAQTETQTGAQTETQKEKESSSISIGTRFALYGSVGVYGMGKISNKLDRSLIENSLDAGKIKETIRGSINQLKDQKNALGRCRLTDKQIKTIDKHIANMEKGLDVPNSEISEVLKERQKLGNKFPGKLLESAGLSISQINKIQDLAGELHGKTIAEMKTILTNNGINDIGEDLLKTLKSAGSVDEIKSMAKLMRHGSKLNRFMQTMAGAMLIDVAFTGLDVRMFIEQRKEAELIAKVNEIRAANKNNQAWTQLMIGISSVAAEAAIIMSTCGSVGSAGGPVGTLIGLAVGAVTTAASMGVDSLYFDVNDFYQQNKDDFLRQKKSSITEAILQGLHNQKEGNSSINEHVHEFVGSFSDIISNTQNGKLKDQKKASLGDACRALIFLDELEGKDFENYAPFHEYISKGKTKEDYLKDVTKGLSNEEAKEVKANFEEQRKNMQKKIEIRMKYMSEVFKKDDVIKNLKKGNGIQTINELCLESRIYAEIGQEKWQGNPTRESYKTNYEKFKSDFFKDFSSQKIAKLEKLKKDNLPLFQELVSSANYDNLLNEDETDTNYGENVKLIQKYQERLKLTQMNADKVGLSIENTHRNMRFIESLIKADFDLNGITKYEGYTEEGAINIIKGNFERSGIMETSDNVWHNVLYRLAKELYGYSGENTKEGIMSFFDEGNDGIHGIYYSNKRKINNDRSLDDEAHGKEGMNKIFSSEEEVKKYVDSFMKINFKRGNVSSIDTATESIDKNLQVEFEKTLKEILTQELMPRTKQNQEKIKNEIKDFVKKYSNGNYLELPYYLVLKARRAGIGNLERQFFKWGNDDALEVLNSSIEMSNNPLGAKVNFVTKARESYTEEEKVYIGIVEDAKNKLSGLFGVKGGFDLGIIKREQQSSELDIPREVKGLFSDKCKEWNKFKERLLLYSPDAASSSSIMEQYDNFTEYFENLYRGILLALTTYKTSNDIDSYGLFQQAESFGNSNYFGKNGEIKTELDIEFFKNKDIKSFYNDQIKKQKIKFTTYDGKQKESTIENLRKSEDNDEKKLAKRASNLIIMTIAEKGMIKKGSSGEITGINIGGNRKDSDITKGVKEQKGETESLISKRLKNIKGKILIDKTKIKTKEQKIQQITKEESDASELMQKIQKTIENTNKDIELQDLRGDITYDPEKKTVKSRGTEIKVDFTKDKKCKIDGLSETLSLEEGIYLALLRNFTRHNFKGRKVEVGKGKHSPLGKETLVVEPDPNKSKWNPKNWFWTRLIGRTWWDENIPTYKSHDGKRTVAKRLTKQIA